MWQIVVFYTLLWLGTNNIFYKDVIINYEKIANWEDEFIPRFVEDNIVLSPSNYSEHKGYTHNFSENNLKNNIHTAILDSNKSQSDFLSGCIFSNINETYYNPILKLISIVNNLANNNGEKTEHLIMYSANSHPIYLNDWEDKHYFTRAFLTLFIFRNGGYLEKQKTAILLQVWAK